MTAARKGIILLTFLPAGFLHHTPRPLGNLRTRGQTASGTVSSGGKCLLARPATPHFGPDRGNYATTPLVVRDRRTWILSYLARLLAMDLVTDKLCSMSSLAQAGGELVPEPWVSVDDVAAHLDVAKESVYRWIDAKRMPAHKIGKLWKFKLSEVDEWVRSGGANGHPAKRRPRKTRRGKKR